MVLEPVHINAYIAPLTNIPNRHNAHHHLYTRDTQLYTSISHHLIKQMLLSDWGQTSAKYKTWLYDNGAVLNESKAEAIVLHSPHLRRPAPIEH